VTVHVRTNHERVELEVIDDGQGFDPDTTGNRSGLGLLSMKERAESLNGSLTITSMPGAGTSVKIKFGRNI
jgi:signal transduction histidine kinase